MSEAITAATGGDTLNMIHVAIAEVKGDSVWIIDATVKHGVDRYPLDIFLSDFTLRDGTYPAFIVKRLKDNSKVQEYVANTRKFIGESYDLHFLPDNGSLYCSELVRDSYVSGGSYVFDAEPMNFKGPDGEFPVYWQQLFEKIGSPIPQDILGTNPQSMSKSSALVTVDIDITK